MGSSKPINLESNKHLEEMAAAEGMTTEEFLQETSKNLQPMPFVIADWLRTLSEDLGINPGDAINYAIIDHMVRMAVEVEMFGKQLNHPYWTVGNDFVGNWDELYILLKAKYQERLKKISGAGGSK